MVTKTKIVLGYMSDGASSAETTVAAEPFLSQFDVYVLLKHRNLQAATTVIGIFVEGVDYIMDDVHGAVEVLSTGGMADATTYSIAYHYNEPTLAWKIQNAIDAEGSGHVVKTAWQGRTGVAIIVYTP